MLLKQGIIPIITALFFLISCGGSSEKETVSNKKIFKYNQSNAVTHLDPAFAKTQANIWAVHPLFDGLVELDEQLNVQPSIAESWTISEDGKTITFRLRDDVYFHDAPQFEGGKGRKVVAEDFVYSFQRIEDEKLGSPGAWIFDNFDNFSAPDDQTFIAQLKEPFKPALGILAMQYCSVVPKEVVEHHGGDFRKNPIGTGAFKFKKWLEGQALFLEKNDNYFQKGLPKLDGIKVSFIGDKKTAFMEFKKGSLDYFSGLESSFANELLTADGDLQAAFANDVNFIKQPYLNTEYLGINMKTRGHGLENKLIRQALNYGFDRELMLKKLRNNVGKPANSGFTPRGLPSFSKDVKGYNYDVEKAKALLKKAGISTKNPLEITLETTSQYLDLCTFIARQWEELGVKAKVSSVESATLRNKMKQGQAYFFRGSWIADYPEAESFMVCFQGEKSAPPNYTQFQNAEFDALYEKAKLENDDAKRAALYHEMDKILIEEAPVVFLFYDETAVFVRKNISGISKNALNLLDLKRVEKQ